MPGNPHDSTWFATPRERRNRKPLSVTLSAEARELLETLACHVDLAGDVSKEAVAKALTADRLPLSTVVEALIWAEGERLGYRTAVPRLFKGRPPAKKKGRGPAKP